jgi:protein-disulfide isomerase
LPKASASTAGLASLKQGKYDAFHRALMADKTPEHQLAEPHLMEIAKSVGLDGVRLKKDMSSPEIAQKLAANIELGHRLGITGTPGLIIGDRLTPGAMPYAAMVEAVATARASQSAENR